MSIIFSILLGAVVGFLMSIIDPQHTEGGRVTATILGAIGAAIGSLFAIVLAYILQVPLFINYLGLFVLIIGVSSAILATGYQRVYMADNRFIKTQVTKKDKEGGGGQSP